MVRSLMFPLLVACLSLPACGTVGNEAHDEISAQSDSQQPVQKGVVGGGDEALLTDGFAQVDGTRVDVSSFSPGKPSNVFVDQAGSALAMSAEYGSCSQVSATIVDESDDSVTLLITEKQGEGDCSAISLTKVVYFALSSPLSERRVILRYDVRRA